MRGTAPEIVRRDLVATHAPDPVPDGLQAATRSDDRPTDRLLGAICDALERHWKHSLAPSWPEMRLGMKRTRPARASWPPAARAAMRSPDVSVGHVG